MDSDTNSADAEQEPDGQRDYQEDDTGARSKAIATTSPVSHVEIATTNGAGSVDVRGCYLDDEPSIVDVRLRGLEGASLCLSFIATEARKFAHDVAEAARFAGESE